MNPNKHDYKDVLKVLDQQMMDGSDATTGCYVTSKYETIRRALLIADKLMQEPSLVVLDALADELDAFASEKELQQAFKAMRDQMLKEIV